MSILLSSSMSHGRRISIFPGMDLSIKARTEHGKSDGRHGAYGSLLAELSSHSKRR